MQKKYAAETFDFQKHAIAEPGLSKDTSGSEAKEEESKKPKYDKSKGFFDELS